MKFIGSFIKKSHKNEGRVVLDYNILYNKIYHI